ncbi:hypothetical protein TNCV_5107941 [Trichonephila clavipes]|nr:hypothetical protein TNCV_5107941 [Trichonephila clavipes]
MCSTSARTRSSKCSTANNDRYILLTANATHIHLAARRRVSSQTIQNRLHTDGLYARKSMNNVRPHTVRLVENFLEAGTTQSMEYPVCSSYLESIEHVWYTFGQRIATRPRPLETVQNLEIILRQEWTSISQSLIDNFLATMLNRRTVVLGVQENHTPY